MICTVLLSEDVQCKKKKGFSSQVYIRNDVYFTPIMEIHDKQNKSTALGSPAPKNTI